MWSVTCSRSFLLSALRLRGLFELKASSNDASDCSPLFLDLPGRLGVSS